MKIRLQDRNKLPPNGIWVAIPQIAYNKQFWSFSDAVAAYQAIAAANPQLNLLTDPVAVANYIDTQNAIRCLNIKGAECYITTEGGQADYSGTGKSVSLPKQLAAVAGSLKKMVQGSGALLDFFDNGGVPVALGIAEHRASICAVCPKNGRGDFTKWFTKPASEFIRKKIESWQSLKLNTSYDDKLNICDLCLCPLKLKCFVDINSIVNHTDKETIESFPDFCWIKKENSELTKPNKMG